MQSPLFEEWVKLSGADSLTALTKGDISTAMFRSEITKDDALIVVDMQRDFVPRSAQNIDGGLLGCPEGELIVSDIARLIRHASNVGATIVATRDYHPHDHCSFLSEGGPFPTHCVQGTPGSKFMPEIALVLEESMLRNGLDRTVVAFKAMHECMDSFGAAPYCKEPFGKGRCVSNVDTLTKEGQAAFSSTGQIMGCTEAPWTGSLVLKQSANEQAMKVKTDNDVNNDNDATFDADAPPDVLAILLDGKERNMRTMLDVLRKNMGSSGRVFVCGLVLDLCVHDTCINAHSAGFEKVALCVDMARAAHIAGMGAYGSGFLADPAAIRKSLTEGGVELVQFSQLVPKCSQIIESVSGTSTMNFPNNLGTMGLQTAPGLRIVVKEHEDVPPGNTTNNDSVNNDSADGTNVVSQNLHQSGYYTISLVGPLKSLARGGGGASAFRNRGVVSPSTLLPRGWPGVASDAQATRVCWAYPMDCVSNSSMNEESMKAFMSISASADLRFAAYGGFLLLDDTGVVVAAQAIGDGLCDQSALQFEEPKPWRKEFTTQLEDAGRLQQVTLSALLARGAYKFCWIGAGETFVKGSEKWVPTEKGGFLYLLSDDREPIYFSIKDF